MLNNMIWMASGIGATVLYQKYNKDIMKLMKKQRNKMMRVETGTCDNN